LSMIRPRTLSESRATNLPHRDHGFACGLPRGCSMSGRDSARGRMSYRLLARFAQRRITRSNAQQKAARAKFNAGTHPRKIHYASFVHRLGLKQRSLACLMERVEILPDAAGELLPSRWCTGTDVQAVPSACRDDRRKLAKGRGCREQRQNRKNQTRPAQFRPP